MISNVRSIDRDRAEHAPPDEIEQVELDFAEHILHMFRFAVTLSSVAEADDLVQDSLTRAWAKRGQFDPARGTQRAWLLAIVADQARGRRRRQRPIWELLDPESLSTPATSELGADLQRAITGLPPRQRAAVVLHHFVDLPVAEVAQLLGCSVGTVKSNLHDARRALAHTLGDSYARD